MSALTRALALATVVVVAITAWPLWVNADFYFVHPSLQILDFASNDMLVVEAKQLSLLHGHYSRAGFYHPGPFYLYWLAGWETLLLDSWPLFASPAAVQHFAATLLMALAFGCFAFLTLLISGSGVTGLGASAALFALIHAVAGNVITAPWAPHMLVASSLFTLCGSIGLLAFGWRWLPLLLFGALQLLHGHASFFGLLPILLLPVLGVALWRHRLPRANAALLISAGITLVMGAPLAAITLVNFPQPWLAYLQQASAGTHLTAAQGLHLLAGFAWVLLLALPLLLPQAVLARRAPTPWPIDLARLRLIALTVGASALLAGTWFALRGVDAATHRYLLFWLAPYCAAPAALAVIACANAVPAAARTLLCAAIVLATWFSCRHMLPWMLHDAAQYANYQRSYRQLQALRGDTALVIRIDAQARYADIWSQLLTLAAWSKRDGNTLFCLTPESWHLSFHHDLRCTTQQLQATPALLVTAASTALAGNVATSLDGIHYLQTTRPLHTTTPQPQETQP